jgi:hypothetical protein
MQMLSRFAGPRNTDIMDEITLITAVVGAVTGILALLKDRARVKLSRRPFDEARLRELRPDRHQPEALARVPVDLGEPSYCLTAVNAGTRPITILEAHAAFDDEAQGLQYQWNTHWLRSVQSLILFDRDTVCVLDETQPMAKFIYPALPARLVALTITTPGKIYRYFPSLRDRWRYRVLRRRWRRLEASRYAEHNGMRGSAVSMLAPVQASQSPMPRMVPAAEQPLQRTVSLDGRSSTLTN